MDQDLLVMDWIDGGKRLIQALAREGFEVGVAFWAKPTEAGKWNLYLASAFVDEKGPRAAYRLVQDTLSKTPDIWIEPFDITVIGMNDSLAEAALKVLKSKVPDSPLVVQTSRAFPPMTRFGESTMAGTSMDGGYIYPPLQPVSST